MLTIALTGLYSSGAFSIASMDRQGHLDVSSDEGAFLGLDIASSVHRGPRGRLVDVTNGFASTSLDVTVSLQDGSTGTLYAGGDSGDSVSFTLLAGETQTVDIDVSGNPDTIYFDVSGQAQDTQISATDRQIDVTGGPPGGP